MFGKIFSFEIQNRIRRPAIYIYFLAVFIFTVGSFATGSLPVGDKEHINAPYLIAFWCSAMTMMMMLISSSVMGTALYRDIEYNTRDYYLTYPITKAGYFWGRFFGSFVFMIVVASAILLGVFIGSKLGPAMGWRDAAQYGSNKLIYYLHPFVTIALPNILFVSSLFFGLVAVTRNVKVIYFGGVLLFLGYFVSFFFLNHSNNQTVIILSDPFGLSAVRFATMNANSITLNETVFPLKGEFLVNRFIWTGVGLAVLAVTYMRFNFEKFFSGKNDRARIDEEYTAGNIAELQNSHVSFEKPYNIKTLKSLTKIELMNILRDNYFWFIVGAGSVFLGFVFWLGQRTYDVPDFPRTVALIDMFNEVFPFFVFFIILFYTGETLHRDRVTRYAFINDSLPPPNWVMNGSKIITLLILALALSVMPVIVGIVVQTLKGFFDYRLGMYFVFVFFMYLPALLHAVIFCYLVHVLINNKFAAHAVAATIWVLVFFLRSSGIFDYNLLLYSYTPQTWLNDMNGIGHMVTPVSWFNLYWSLFAGLLIIVAALFFFRGVGTTLKERLRLVPERFDRTTKIFTLLLLMLFLGVGAFNYYNVSYVNTFITKWENTERGILYEKKLKHYDSLPIPTVTAIKMKVDLYPGKNEACTHAWVSIVNKTDRPISQMLLDAENITEYSIAQNGKAVAYMCPLVYPRGLFNIFRPKYDTADFRLYTLENALTPGDSTVLEIESSIIHKGFTNRLYAATLLDNGTFFTGGLPGIGYDDDDEVSSPYERRKHGLPEKKDEDAPQDDPVAINTLRAGKAAGLFTLDITVSTPLDQQAVAPGQLIQSWREKGRNIFHFVQEAPGFYPPFSILCARYIVTRDSVMLGHKVFVEVMHDPHQSANTARFINAYKDALKYFSKCYGDYPFKNIRLAETSSFGPRQTSQPTLDTYAEFNSWNAHFTNPNQIDFISFNIARATAQQWWRFKVAPNATMGSLVIPEGLSVYSALVYWEKKHGLENVRQRILDQIWVYLFVRRRLEETEHPLMSANLGIEWADKAGVALYGLRNLIGEQNMNQALTEFEEAYGFKKDEPYAGANDLYRYLKKHTPDSLQYFLDDTWEKVTLYDNRIKTVTIDKSTDKNEYKLTVTVSVDKMYLGEKQREIPANNMNDYIDIGIFGKDIKSADGSMGPSLIDVNRYKLTRGDHTFTIVVDKKPARVVIDPYGLLIDRNSGDNVFDISKK